MRVSFCREEKTMTIFHVSVARLASLFQSAGCKFYYDEFFMKPTVCFVTPAKCKMHHLPGKSDYIKSYLSTHNPPKFPTQCESKTCLSSCSLLSILLN